MNTNDTNVIEEICEAYESGFGHGLKDDGLKGPYHYNISLNHAYTYGYDSGLERKESEEKPISKPELDLRDFQLACQIRVDGSLHTRVVTIRELFELWDESKKVQIEIGIPAENLLLE